MGTKRVAIDHTKYTCEGSLPQKKLQRFSLLPNPGSRGVQEASKAQTPSQSQKKGLKMAQNGQHRPQNDKLHVCMFCAFTTFGCVLTQFWNNAYLGRFPSSKAKKGHMARILIFLVSSAHIYIVELRKTNANRKCIVVFNVYTLDIYTLDIWTPLPAVIGGIWEEA